MNKEKIDLIVASTEEDVAYAKEVSDKIVIAYTQTLDDIMRDINNDIISSDDYTDDLLQNYFMQLANALYFISSKCEGLGFYEDIAKANAKLKYNKAYGDNKLTDLVNSQGKTAKPTVAENTIYAENESMDESIVSIIYSRSKKIVQAKVESAQEMLRTMSKLISKKMQDVDVNRFATRGEVC